MKKAFVNILSNYLWLMCIIIGLSSALFIWLGFKTDRESFTLLKYLFYIFVFILILLGISFFPNTFKHKYLLLIFIFIFYMGYINPKLNYFTQMQQVEQYYIYENTFLNPLIFFAVCFAYRLGGGKSSHCFKTGISAIILLFSGFLDFMWFIINNVPYAADTVSIPHIKIIIGHEPTFIELCLFILVHIALIIILNVLPFEKWLKNTFKRKNFYA